MKLINIPENKYYDYKINAMFDCYKWDPQFCDKNTLSKYVLILSKEENDELIKLTEKLDKETRLAEEFLNKNIKVAKKLSLPNKILEKIDCMKNYDNKNNIRLMRYDFHPNIEGGWSVTEVNSDVPRWICGKLITTKSCTSSNRDEKFRIYFFWRKND